MRVDDLRFSSVQSVFFAAIISFLMLDAARAAEPCEDCAERYIETVDRRRIQARIEYLLPTDPLDLDRTKKREKEKPTERSDDEGFNLSEPGRVGWMIVSGILLAGLGYILYQNSAGGLVVFRSLPEDADKPGSKASGTDRIKSSADDGLPQSEAAFLAEIERMEDRREALHLLAGRLLSNAANSTGIRPGRSWTARESLRALPRNWVHLGDLRHLNRQAELAWFGGKHVEDTVFADCLDRARGMMRASAAR